VENKEMGLASIILDFGSTYGGKESAAEISTKAAE